MKHLIRIGGLFILLAVFSVSTTLAEDQEQKRDQKKDGSCQTVILKRSADFTLSADQTKDQTQTKDQKKDGSCGD